MIKCNICEREIKQHTTGEGYLLFKSKAICTNCAHEIIPYIYKHSFYGGSGGFAAILFKECLKLVEFRKRRPNLKNRKKIFFQLLNKYKFKCVKCNTTNNLEIDHIIPISKGGTDEIKNLQILCKTCNVKKSNKI